ncbi:hypothetical protein MNBD_NITROSPINAE02-1486 [hydrothermal vent metagenome]|uniref:Polysaccharide biosynthesis protein C-terminal domain-containing protein n=1 Tax=hydrothermal vent metagenome TaxID=652676 RepID=A0A3B1CE21_9ZZZZ
MKSLINKAVELWRRYSHINMALTDQMMVSGVNFLTGILMARYLGLREFGVFTIAWMAVLFCNSIQRAMIITPMMSIGPKQSKDEAPAYFGAIAVQQIFVTVFSALLIYAGTFGLATAFPQWNIHHLSAPLAASAFAYQSQDFIRRYFFTKDMHFAAFVNDFISYGGQIALLLWLFLSGGATSDSVLWIIAITSAIATATGVMRMEKLQWPTYKYFLSSCRRHWDFSKWMTSSVLMDWASGQFFTIAATAYLGPAAAGAMKACQNIMGVLHILFFGLSNVIPVRAAKILHSRGVLPMVDYLRKIALYGGIVTALYAMLAAIAPDFWLHTIYGEEYRGFGFVLRWYALIYVLLFFNTPLRAGLTALEYSKPIFVGRVVTAIFTFISIAPLISNYEIAGAVFGIFCVRVIHNGILLVALGRRIKG